MSSIKSRKFTEVTFVNGVVKHEDIVYPIMDIIKVPTEGVRMYGIVFLIMSQLDPCSQMLYHWCIMEMTESMVVSTDSYQRSRFISYAKKLGIQYKDVTVTRSFGQLYDKELLVKMQRGRAKVNPEYVYKGSPQERKKHIKIVKYNTNEDNTYTLDKGEVVKRDNIKKI